MAWVGAEAAAAGAAVEDGGRPLLGVSAKSLICISFSHKPNETALLDSTSLVLFLACFTAVVGQVSTLAHTRIISIN